MVVFPIGEPLLPIARHHPPLCFGLRSDSIKLDATGLTGDRFYRDFSAVDINILLDFLSQFKWDSLFRDRLVDYMLSIFYDIIYLAVDYFVPLIKYSARKFSF